MLRNVTKCYGFEWKYRNLAYDNKAFKLRHLRRPPLRPLPHVQHAELRMRLEPCAAVFAMIEVGGDEFSAEFAAAD
jgi:hypothetical protein